MEDHEAVDLLSRMQAAWPGRDYTGEHGRLMFEALADADRADAEGAVDVLIRESVFPPAPADVYARTREHRNARVAAAQDDGERRALASWAHIAEMAPAAVRDALRPYWERFGGRDRAVLALAVERGDTAARTEAARRLAAAQIEADADTRNERTGQLRPEPTGEVVGRSACGTAWGELARWDDGQGVWVCPGCGAPIRDGCRAVRA